MHKRILLFPIIVLMTLLPAAAPFSLRRLQDKFMLPPISCYIENGFDYVGFDMANEQGPVDSCCSKCSSLFGCKAWSWSNLNGGTCWLKSGRGEIVVNPNVKSALFLRGNQPVCVVKNDLDYVGNDIARVSSQTVDGCCDICHNYPGCRAYSWSDYQGGSCWLKSKVTSTIYNAGVKSAMAYPDYVSSCPTQTNDVDYVGNDIGNKPSPTADGCCDICKGFQGCRAYSWSNLNGGTCWLKNVKGDTVSKAGVISAQVIPNPPPQCQLSNDLDYIDNDIANVPSSDPLLCCTICREYKSGCKAFSWSNYNGGTCWLKSAKGQDVYKQGVKSATV